MTGVLRSTQMATITIEPTPTQTAPVPVVDPVGPDEDRPDHHQSCGKDHKADKRRQVRVCCRGSRTRRRAIRRRSPRPMASQFSLTSLGRPRSAAASHDVQPFGCCSSLTMPAMTSSMREPSHTNLGFVWMVGRCSARINPDELIQRSIYQGNNARLDHVIRPASADDWRPGHPRPGSCIN
jgi:hypothetical protein